MRLIQKQITKLNSRKQRIIKSNSISFKCLFNISLQDWKNELRNKIRNEKSWIRRLKKKENPIKSITTIPKCPILIYKIIRNDSFVRYRVKIQV